MGGIPVLTNEYLGTKFGEPFLMFGSGEGIQKGCLSLIPRLAYVFYQSQNTGSLMEHLESAQKFSFKYILCMHSNVENFFPCIFGLFENKTKATYIKFCYEVFNRVLR